VTGLSLKAYVSFFAKASAEARLLLAGTGRQAFEHHETGTSGSFLTTCSLGDLKVHGGDMA
jgi:hypothetical protein